MSPKAYTLNIPSLLSQANCSLVLSTIKGNRLVCISAKNEKELVQTSYSFPMPKGISVQSDQLALACKEEVFVFKKMHQEDWHLQQSYPIGNLDIHDLHFAKQQLWAVNTVYSSIGTIGGPSSFTPHWQPPFIDQLVPEDRCHLNGLVLKNDTPLYATALNSGNSPRSWRFAPVKSGVLIHIPSNEILLRGLSYPHTPQFYDNKLYILNSGLGELICVDEANGTYEVVAKMEGFVRGMARCGDHLFIGYSKRRKVSSSAGKLGLGKKIDCTGIAVVNLLRGQIVGEIDQAFFQNIDEIYSIHSLVGNLSVKMEHQEFSFSSSL